MWPVTFHTSHLEPILGEFELLAGKHMTTGNYE